ncbi:hypothetical protein PDESU_03703 [Pontiella desulfatans]|uniref:Uncharacterized protein n=1 Tax=Pontiella desulfatans TaxID=2750659 RepID=A0A6C2U5G7_PONDE|nr:gamma-glutamylcyclotransferase family protein [Pontiella desulfatans]VGO15123.1 hypothetical protein PDESU_03703 [Pontiella desulfatans]
MNTQTKKNDIIQSVHRLIENAKTMQNSDSPETYHPFLINLYETIKAVLKSRFWQHFSSLPVAEQKLAFNDYTAILSVDDTDSLEQWGEILLHCNGGVSKKDIDTLQDLDREYRLVSEMEGRIKPNPELCEKSIELTKQLVLPRETSPEASKHPESRNDFRATFVLVNLQKWRNRETSLPFYERSISFAGKEQTFDVYDEAMVITHRSIDAYDKPNFVLQMKSSGIQCLDSLLPTDYQVDNDTYRREGQIDAEIPVLSKDLNYAKKTWNGFQGSEQDFAVTTRLGTTTDLLLAIDFSSILGTVDFKQLPSAWLEETRFSTNPPENIPITRSTDSSLWFAKVSPDNSNPNRIFRLKIKWELCEPTDDDEVYIFSYASLLSADQISGTLGRKVTDSDLKTAVLHDYRREWTAFSRLTTGCAGNIDFCPDYMAYANVHPAQGGRCNGVLFKVKRSELKFFDARERNYCRVNVTDLIDTKPDIPVYTYSSIPRGPLDTFSKRAFIRKDYVDLISHSLQGFDQTFRDEYWETFANPADIPICDACPATEKERYKF